MYLGIEFFGPVLELRIYTLERHIPLVESSL
jgi:hypothetical protein